MTPIKERLTPAQWTRDEGLHSIKIKIKDRLDLGTANLANLTYLKKA